MSSADVSRCLKCGGEEAYEFNERITARGFGLDLLPGLGSVFSPAKIRVLVCSQCGLINLFAAPDVIERLPTSDRWKPI